MPFQVLNPATAAAAPVTTAGAPLISTGETLLSIRDELVLQMESRTSLTSAGNTRINKHINWAYISLCSMIDLTELHSDLQIDVVASQPLYNLPRQISVARQLAIVDAMNYAEGGRILAKIDYKSYRRQTDYPATDEPRAWFRYNRMLVLWPTPVAARTAALEFKIRPDDLTADTHSPIIPVEWHEAILLFAKSRIERSVRMYQAAQQSWNDALTIIRPILNTDAAEAGTQDARVYSPRFLRYLYRGRR